MAFGTFGSTLSDELNRLANGGTYRDSSAMVDEALAAKQWANRENIVPYSTDTVGILNEIAALGPNRQNWYDFNGVCNYLAGTTGLPAAAALRQITTTGDILTSLAAFYTDAATPRYNYPGYVRLNGVDGNYISIPDATALDVTGDIDLRIKVALDDWTPSVTQTLLSKLNTSQYSYQIILNTSGTVSFRWSANGTTLLTSTSSVAPTVADGATLWVRATMDVDNGASGNTVTFFTSNNGTSWTQLGTTIITAGVTSIFNGTASVEIGSHFAGSNVLSGNIYQAQIFASLNGTDKRLDVDLTTNVTSATYDTFTATTGQLCTINGQNTLTNGGSAGSLLPITVGSSLAADSNDAKFLAHDGTNYVYTPGVISNFISVPDANDLDITGDIDLRVQLAMDDWTPSAIAYPISKHNGTVNSYSIFVNTDGTLNLNFSVNGSTGVTATSLATGVADGTVKWIRATRVASTGVVKFLLSDDGTTWTQLGTDVSSTSGNLFVSTANVVLGSRSDGGNSLAGKIYRAQILNGIDGTKVLDVDTSVITTGAATSFTAVTGQTVTINRSTSGRKTVAVTQPTWLFGTDDYMEVNNRYMAHSTSDENYVYLSGNTGNYMSVADNPPLDVTGDIDIQVKVALDDWTPATSNVLVAKRNTNVAYQFFVNGGAGLLGFLFSTDGTAINLVTSTVAPTVTDGSTLWVRATRVASTGVIQFFTSTNGTTWTQLGADVTSTAGNIYSSADAVEIGTRSAGTNLPAKGAFYRTIIKNGINGTTVLDANAATITSPSQTTFTDSSSNAYTVTINKSGVGTFVSTGNYLYLPGIDNNLASSPDSAALDITGDLDLRVKVAMDDWTPSAASMFISKYINNTNVSYQFYLNTNGTMTLSWSPNGTIASTIYSNSIATGIADGTTKWVRATLDVDNGASGFSVQFFTSDNGITWTQLGTTNTVAGVTSIFNSTSQLGIGAVGTAGSTYFPARGKFFRAQVLNGIGGTLAFDANFEGSITSLNQASFTESSSNAATVTINRSGSTYRSAGVIDAGYLYPGATNTFTNSTTDFLNFGATQSFTAIVINRIFSTNSNFGTSLMKGQAASQGGNRGYLLYNNGTSANTATLVSDGTNQTGNNSFAYTYGSLNLMGILRDTVADRLSTLINSTTQSTTDITTGTLETPFPLTIGSNSPTKGNYLDGEIYAVAVFRQALTAAQIRQVTNYFANREVYL